jgi:hypothetical protein
MTTANTTIVVKKSATPGNIPTNLANGELAINYADGKLYYKNASNVISYIADTNSFTTINANSTLILASSPSDILSINGANGISVSACSLSKIITIDGGVVFNQSNLAYNQTQVTVGVDATQNLNISAASTLAQNAYNAANTKFSSSGGNISGNVTITGSLSVTGNVNITGNVTQVSGNSGQFFGNTAGFGALYAGVPYGYLLEPQIITQITSNYNGYAGGINMQNINSGSNASSDLFISADNGTLYDGFLDLGLASSNYSYPGYTLIGNNDGYWIVTGNTITGGGNMIMSTGYNNDIIFAQGGTNENNEVARFKYGTGFVSEVPIVLQSTSANTNKTIVQASTSSNTQTTIDTWSISAYRSAKYIVQMTQNSNCHVIELLLLQNGSSSFLTQYGEVTSGTILGTFDSSITGSTLNLLITPTSSNLMTINIVRDLISV